MAGEVLLLLYGLCSLGAGLNFPAWARLALQRWRNPERERPWWDDVLMLARFGISCLALGASGLAGLRTGASLLGSMPLEVPSLWGVLFIGLMAVAEPFFLRIDEIHARTRGGHSLAWRLYWVLAVGWTLLIAAIWICP